MPIPSEPVQRPLARTALYALLITLGLAGCAATPAAAPVHAGQPPADPADSGKGIVASAHPEATRAGVAVLERGGSAIDAAVAVQAMLGLVEPQSSGPAGGAILLHYRADSGRVDAYIGRERAPAAADSSLFDDGQGKPLPRSRAMLSGRATGVPGVLPALEMAQKEHGRLAWSMLFDDAIALARQGFTVTPRLQQHIDGSFPQATAPDVVRLFSRPDGTRLRTGDTLRNPAYAESMRLVARHGAAALQSGPLAQQLLERVAEPPYPAQMTLEDLGGYRAERVDPVCRPLRSYRICVPPPPASGVGLLQLMLLLDGTDIAERGPDDPQAWLLFAEASRLMYADRDHYVGDPDFVTVPVDGLLDPDYLNGRRALIGPQAAPAAPEHGLPRGAPTLAADATLEPGGTSHFVVVDAQGNVVSMTTTVESFFGSGRTVGGMVLNNQLTDFSWTPGGPAANAIAPGKRPRSSMSPVIVLDQDGGFVGALGSPGGNAIPAYLAKTLVGWLYWNLPLDEAIALPNLVARGSSFNGEAEAFAPELRTALSELGVTIRSGAGEDSGLHGVTRSGNRIDGAADPRREGSVVRAGH